MAQLHNFIALTIPGLEQPLSVELGQLGAGRLQPGKGYVGFTGPLELVYKTNLGLSTGLRILLPLAEGTITDINEIYDLAKSIDWKKYLKKDGKLFIRSSIHSKLVNNKNYASLKVKDAIVDQLRDKQGNRPTVEQTDADLSVYILMEGGRVRICLDTTGNSLHMRGYRMRVGDAPLRENLAAGIVRLTGYDGTIPFLDPMCGSGTVAIEAALLAANIPPNLKRKDFAFQKLPIFNKEKYVAARVALNKQIKTPAQPIVARDIDPKMVQIAKENAKRAGVEEYITFETADFFKTSSDTAQWIVTNPPYGERISVEGRLMDFYKQIGDTLKNGYKGSRAFIFSGYLDGLKHFGLRPSKKIHIKNGPIDSRLYAYDLF